MLVNVSDWSFTGNVKLSDTVFLEFLIRVNKGLLRNARKFFWCCISDEELLPGKKYFQACFQMWDGTVPLQEATLSCRRNSLFTQRCWWHHSSVFQPHNTLNYSVTWERGKGNAFYPLKILPTNCISCGPGHTLFHFNEHRLLKA